MARPPSTPLGPKVRVLRRRHNMTQAQLAQKLGISASYLNLIESNKRPLTAELLLSLAQVFSIDLHVFGADEEARTIADLGEVFSDPLFEEQDISQAELRDLATTSPAAARAVVRLYQTFKNTRDNANTLAVQVADGIDRSRVSSEEVTELIHRHQNYFGELEAGAEQLWTAAKLDRHDLFPGLVRYLEGTLGIQVRFMPPDHESGVRRRFDPEGRKVILSELLPTRSRNFELAHIIGLLSFRSTIDALVQDEVLTTPESRALARVALANTFAAGVVMPYTQFLEVARKERYDVDVIGRRFRVSFEQVCHRLTSLRRPDHEGVPFHFMRIDVAGNISKRFSGSGIRFARFSGACPRWNVFSAFMTPMVTRTQISVMPEGDTYFCIARMIHKDSGGFHTQHPVQAVGLGCRIEYAKELVYADGMDLDAEAVKKHAVPVGVSCRICERGDCEQRALPSVRNPLHIDENVRRVTPFAPVEGR